MTRVSENSTTSSVQYTLEKGRKKLEDLQIRGAKLKNITKPSDNPLGNIRYLKTRSTISNSEQFIKNLNNAKLNLGITEKTLSRISEILSRTKEIAIAQSSDLYDKDIRKNISNEVIQLKSELINLANKRIGERYIFGGFKSLSPPFNKNGEYTGDSGKVKIEISRDFFIPINIPGNEVFSSEKKTLPTPLEKKDSTKLAQEKSQTSREVSSKIKKGFSEKNNLFSNMKTLISALENNDSQAIRSTLERFDKDISRIITLQTRIGAITQSIENAEDTLESGIIHNKELGSKLVDVDLAKLFSDIQKQQDILKTSYKASQALISPKLIDFLR